MIITIPPWDEMQKEFGLTPSGRIGTTSVFYWTRDDEDIIGPSRTIEVNDTPDGDGDYWISDTRYEDTGGISCCSHIMKPLYNLCVKQAFGSTRIIYSKARP